MTNYDMFSWDEPKPAGYTSMHDQKEATYMDVSAGVPCTNAWVNFRTNDDEMGNPQVGMVLGETPMELVYGEGYVAISTNSVVNNNETPAENPEVTPEPGDTTNGEG